MTPKQLLGKMEQEANKGNEIAKARYEGAVAMYECVLDKQRRYYKSHREHNQAYHRAYYKARREKAKEVEKSE